jgi:hypothetical protein
MIAFLHHEALYGGRDGRVSLEVEVLDGLDLAVGGDQAADRTALDRDCMYFQRSLMEILIKDEEKENECGRNPYPPPRRRCFRVVSQCQPVVFQGAAGIPVSSNLPFRRARQYREALHARYYI